MRSKVKVIFAVIGFFALLGCAGSPVGDLIAGPEKLAQQDDAYCKSIGLSFGSPDYANCRMLQDVNRESRHAQANALSDSLLAAGATVASSQPPSPQVAPLPNILPPPPVHCRSIGTGYGTVQTVCQ